MRTEISGQQAAELIQANVEFARAQQLLQDAQREYERAAERVELAARRAGIPVGQYRIELGSATVVTPEPEPAEEDGEDG